MRPVLCAWIAFTASACLTDPEIPPHDAGSAFDAGIAPDAGGHDSGTPDSGQPFDAGWVDTSPIQADAGVWTFIPFPHSACNDGTPVGLGINPSPTGSNNLLIYFNGGGACWDYTTCYVFGSAVLGPYPPSQLDKDVAVTGCVLHRDDPKNPFRDWNYAYVPYCTGDVHAGNNVATYTQGVETKTFHHVGHANFLAYLDRLVPTFPSPDRLVVTGDSAGGGGAIMNYDSARRMWPHAESYLIDDSLAFFPSYETPAPMMTAELANWGVQPLFAQICGSACQSDFSLVYPALGVRYAGDRMALLSYESDATMAAYYVTLPQVYQVYLNQLASQVLKPANIQTYFVNGTGHTILWQWDTLSTSTSVNLRDWLTQMADNDAGWSSVGP